MKKYELMVILSPQLTEAETEKLYSEIKGFFDEVLFEDIWGKRTFAYPIKKFADGYYVVWNFRVNVDKVSDLYEFLRLHPSVLRHLLIIVPESYEPKKHEELDERLDAFYEEKAEKKAKRGQDRGKENKENKGVVKSVAAVEKKIEVEKKEVVEVKKEEAPRVSVPEETILPGKDEVADIFADKSADAVIAHEEAPEVLEKPKKKEAPKPSEPVDSKLDEKLKSIFDDELSF